ncbi:MAG: hypothetical protein EZS28_052553 [Streblomastix strix]|uniref:Uncharacterized protein n=1 Tax=Streblomastix strix TaxID=222440 RepID=A0A5J4S454_9EUKA|nr:MAG: hypothetical protein EZS28_052553 [Streblomastix strix]
MSKAQYHSAAMMQSILDLDRELRLLPGEMGDQNIVDISRKIVLDSISARRKQKQQNQSPCLSSRIAHINRTVPEFSILILQEINKDQTLKKHNTITPEPPKDVIKSNTTNQLIISRPRPSIISTSNNGGQYLKFQKDNKQKQNLGESGNDGLLESGDNTKSIDKSQRIYSSAGMESFTYIGSAGSIIDIADSQRFNPLIKNRNSDD